MNKNNNPTNLTQKMIILFFVVLSLLVLLFSSCNPKLQPTTHTKQIEKDSVFTTVKHVYKDTTIVIPGDKIEVKVPVYSLSEIPTTIRTKDGLHLQLQRLNDSILANCNQEDKRQIIQLQNQIIQTYQSKIKQLEQTEIIKEKYTPKLTKILAWVGGIATLTTLLFGFFRIKKFLKI